MEFKGTKGNFKEDLGVDELEYNLYQMAICDEYYNVVGYSYGKNEIECIANGKLFAKSKEMLEILKIIIDGNCNIPEWKKVMAKKLIKKATEL